MEGYGSDIKGVKDYKLELAQKVRMTCDRKREQSERPSLFTSNRVSPIDYYSSSTSF